MMLMVTQRSEVWIAVVFLMVGIQLTSSGNEPVSETPPSTASTPVPLVSSPAPADTPNTKNYSAPLGSSIHLPCPVKLHPGFNRATAYPRVSWIRRKDWHILTVGRKEYTSDQRFKVVHREGSLDWYLQIKYLQNRDSGLYECQVTMGSITTNHLAELSVLEPQAELEGGGEMHLEEGTSFQLICRVVTTVPPPAYVFWYKENTMVNYDYSDRLSVGIEHLATGVTESRLDVRRAAILDTGNYTCSPANSRPAHVSIFVNKGDKMQPRKSQGDTSSASRLCAEYEISGLISFSLLYALFKHWL